MNCPGPAGIMLRTGKAEAANHAVRRRDYGVLALLLSALGLGCFIGGDDE